MISLGQVSLLIWEWYVLEQANIYMDIYSSGSTHEGQVFEIRLA